MSSDALEATLDRLKAIAARDLEDRSLTPGEAADLLAALAVAREREQRAVEALDAAAEKLDVVRRMAVNSRTAPNVFESIADVATWARDDARAALVDEPAAATLAEPGEGGVEGDVPQDRGSGATVQTSAENGAPGQEVGLAAPGSASAAADEPPRMADPCKCGATTVEGCGIRDCPDAPPYSTVADAPPLPGRSRRTGRDAVSADSPTFTLSKDAPVNVLEARILAAFTYPHHHPGIAGVAEGAGCPRCNAEKALAELVARGGVSPSGKEQP